MHSKKVTRYYSECGKGHWDKRTALTHEDNCTCWTNPKNRTCKTCEHGQYVSYDSETGDGGAWDCYSENEKDKHSGGPRGVDYISVKCELYTPKISKG